MRYIPDRRRDGSGKEPFAWGEISALLLISLHLFSRSYGAGLFFFCNVFRVILPGHATGSRFKEQTLGHALQIGSPMASKDKLNVQKKESSVSSAQVPFTASLAAIPHSTCRIQFSSEFTFADFKEQLPYLHRLGIRTIYASPLFRSVKGSRHGYDGLDPHLINEEIGIPEQLREISAWLTSQGMSWLQDIVPNHMAYHPENRWIFELFEWGKDSPHSRYFDIDWDHPDEDLKGKVMLPVLGEDPEKLIASGEIALVFKNGGFYFSYGDHSFPLSAESYPVLLSGNSQCLSDEFAAFLTFMSELVQRKRMADWASCKQQLNGFFRDEEKVRRHIHSVIEYVNHHPDPRKIMLKMQYYRLSHWMETNRRLNYRRFFTINDLICLRMEDPAVFCDYHSEIKRFVDEGIFQGLRVDHADGLFHPRAYLLRLRQLVGSDVYLITEKILEAEEELPHSWPVDGTSGYDFLSLVNNLLTNERCEQAFEAIYRQFGAEDTDYAELVYQKKKFVLLERMHGDLDNLVHLFFKLSLDLDPLGREQVKAVLTEFIVLCPVYRIYPEDFPLKGKNRQLLKAIFDEARDRIPELGEETRFFERLFNLEVPGAPEKKEEIGFFFRRCMQFTGPVMAKGVEDTGFYTYSRFIAHNEVGDSPRYFGMPVSAFHDHIRERTMNYPHTMNTTATHDTKRGEDSRARLLVLSDIPRQWEQAVLEWKELNRSGKVMMNGQQVPVPKDEYFIYQSLVGAFSPEDLQEEQDFTERFTAFVVKALREGKENSSWLAPNEEYEQGTTGFIRKILCPGTEFYRHFRQFLERIAGFGMINSLCQIILKHTCPGVPDTYQGGELWDFSMVDPDNRRPVDYVTRDQWLKEIQENSIPRPAVFGRLWHEWKTGKIKLALTTWLLQERNRHPEVFRDAGYIPLQVTGRYQDHLIAFLRPHEQAGYLVAVPLHLASVVKDFHDLSSFDWQDTAIELPSDQTGNWLHLFSGKKIPSSGKILMRSVFDEGIPLAFLKQDRTV